MTLNFLSLPLVSLSPLRKRSLFPHTLKSGHYSGGWGRRYSTWRWGLGQMASHYFLSYLVVVLVALIKPLFFSCW